MVEADVIEVISAVRAFEQLSVHFLLILFCKQELFYRWQQWKCAETGLCFQYIFSDRYRLTAYRVLKDLVLSCYGLSCAEYRFLLPVGLHSYFQKTK